MSGPNFWGRFILAALATWRVTHLLANEDGPGEVIALFRAWLGNRAIGKMMDCFNCLSLWIAAPSALFVSRRPLEWSFCWLALSSSACLLERLGQGQAVIQPTFQPVEGDFNNVLRPETSGDTEQSGAESGTDPAQVRLGK